MDDPILSEFFEYSPSSPSGLRWKADVRGGSWPKIGDYAGSIFTDRKGYRCWRVGLNRKYYLAHRIVYEIVTGEKLTTDDQIDHINGDALDNTIDNLRKADFVVNARNHRMQINNTSGRTGVIKRREFNGYEVQYRDASGRRRSKFFSISKHGENAIDIAHAWRKKQINDVGAFGIAYTSRHGKP